MALRRDAMADRASDGLQFETAGPPVGAGTSCAVCGQTLSSAYYTLGGRVACERCKSEVAVALQRRPGLGAYLRATLLGSLAGIVGAGVWYGVRVATGYEIGLIAIAVGYLVGIAVKKASGGRGGPLFQVLAIALTYFWVVANYIPDIAAGLGESPAAESGAEAGPAPGPRPADLPGPAFAAVVVTTALALPFLMGVENAIGILIIGFALYEAWKLNKRVAIAVAGPFALGAAPGAPPGA